jgi:hypothetical protein
VDGVLNAVTSEPGPHWKDWRSDRAFYSAEQRGFAVTWAAEVVAFLHEMHDQGVEVIWLTTWGKDAVEIIAPLLGLPLDWAVAGEVPQDADPEWWKLPLAKALWEKDGKPFVWIDDDLIYAPEADDWLASLPGDTRYLAIAPNWEEGITPAHVEQVRAFVADFVANGAENMPQNIPAGSRTNG